MKRRDFLTNSTLGGMSLFIPFSAIAGSTRVGIVASVFRVSGYKDFSESGLMTFESHAKAYDALVNGKIDVLVSSTHFSATARPEYSLFGNIPFGEADGAKDLWLSENYHHIQSLHAAKGLNSELVGTMSPLMVRVSNLKEQELANWTGFGKQIKVSSSGVQAAWFEHLGFYVKKTEQLTRVSSQLNEISNQYIDVTDSFSPLMFLQVANDNISRGIKSSCSRTVILTDSVTKGSMPIEIIFRPGSKRVAADLKAKLQEKAVEDRKVQLAALSALSEKLSAPVQGQLPQNLVRQLIDCKQTYLEVVKNLSPLSAQLAAGAKKHLPDIA